MSDDVYAGTSMYDDDEPGLAGQLEESKRENEKLKDMVRTLAADPEPKPTPKAPKEPTREEIQAAVDGATTMGEMYSALAKIGDPVVDQDGFVVSHDEHGNLVHTRQTDASPADFNSMSRQELDAAIGEAEAMPAGDARDRRLAELGMPAGYMS